MNFKVAIIGRPNVGKSSLFNRILNKRLAIVYEKAGTTKDRIYAEATWLNQKFFIIDTGGIVFEDAPLVQQIKYQTELAISECDLIIWVTDGQNGLVQEDFEITKLLYKNNKNVILAVNKIDNVMLHDNIYDFYSLGFNNIIGISTQHGIGIGKLLDKIISYLPRNKKTISNSTEDLKFCLVGRINVGKSTLTNAILSQDRMIISEIPGTTTDAVDTIFDKNNQRYHIIDTAGFRKNKNLYEKQNKYSFLRALDAIERSDIVCFVLDINQPITEQDRSIAALIFNYSKPCVIVCNKWDLLKTSNKDMKKFEVLIRTEFKFFVYAPIVFLSAKNKKRINTLFTTLDKVFSNYKQRFSSHLLNDILNEAVQLNPPSFFNQGKAKFYYLKQVATKSPEFICLVNDPKFIHFSYERFLKNQLRTNLELIGIPLKIIFKKKEVFV
ncbi:ribosome biogenesis GTPase Der [Columbia Basin potato purple top phytoplasma]|uniref:GTPase Der n=1 Tax=Columbia Basin potato purple top phytoplasma TaxID=307134 RepID=A0ABT5L917_9MOLU|nr:ribosome biogenesis GTPase Der [Columbia Basin potato purple top phytoplasma]MDC9032107.1 ribosome biogenesis GTPase Der [Columbia Basin potato purple top phytoplasma]